MRKSRKRSSWKTGECRIKSPRYPILRTEDQKAIPAQSPKGRTRVVRLGALTKRRARPGAARTPPAPLPEHPAGTRDLPDRAAGPARQRRLPTCRHQAQRPLLPDCSDSSSQRAVLQQLLHSRPAPPDLPSPRTPLSQAAKQCTQSSGPEPVFKGFCPRRRRLHSPAARPSRTLASKASLLLLPPR